MIYNNPKSEKLQFALKIHKKFIYGTYAFMCDDKRLFIPK